MTAGVAVSSASINTRPAYGARTARSHPRGPAAPCRAAGTCRTPQSSTRCVGDAAAVGQRCGTRCGTGCIAARPPPVGAIAAPVGAPVRPGLPPVAGGFPPRVSSGRCCRRCLPWRFPPVRGSLAERDIGAGQLGADALLGHRDAAQPHVTGEVGQPDAEGELVRELRLLELLQGRHQGRIDPRLLQQLRMPHGDIEQIETHHLVHEVRCARHPAQLPVAVPGLPGLLRGHAEPPRDGPHPEQGASLVAVLPDALGQRTGEPQPGLLAGAPG